MLDLTAFEQWCEQLAFSPETRKLIAHICSSPPSRVVQSSAGNVSPKSPAEGETPRERPMSDQN